MDHIGFYLRDIYLQKKNGNLVFKRKDIKKHLSFQDGFLVFAQSTQKQELLEEVLYKMGNISDETYLSIDLYREPGKNIEDILVARRLLKSKDLQEAQLNQMKEIALNIFSAFDGKIDFQEIKDFFGLISKQKISISILIAEGIRRMKYNPVMKTLLQKKIFFRKFKDFSFRLKEEEKGVLGTIDGNSAAEDLFRSYDFKPEFFWKSVYLLYCLDLIDIKSTKKVSLHKELCSMSQEKVPAIEEIDFLKMEKTPPTREVEIKREEKFLEEEIEFITQQEKQREKPEVEFAEEKETHEEEKVSTEKEKEIPKHEEMEIGSPPEVFKKEEISQKETEEISEEERAPIEKEAEVPKIEEIFEEKKEEIPTREAEFKPVREEAPEEEEEKVPVEEEEVRETAYDDTQNRIKEVIAMKWNLSSMDYYQIIDVPKTATSAEIKKAYFQLARKYHPDRFSRDLPSQTREVIQEVFGHITKAYNALISDEERKRYDSEASSGRRGGRKDQAKIADIRFRQGKTLYNQGRYEEAQLLLEEAVRMNRDKGSYYLLLAMIELKLPAFHRKAERDFLKAQDLEPWNPEGYGGLGLLYKQAGLLTKAKKQFQKALEVDPDYKIAHKELQSAEKGKKKLGLKEILTYDIFGGSKKK